MVRPEKKRRCSAAVSRPAGLSNRRPSTLTRLSLPITSAVGRLAETASALSEASSTPGASVA
jgi:hypothetical protein